MGHYRPGYSNRIVLLIITLLLAQISFASSPQKTQIRQSGKWQFAISPGISGIISEYAKNLSWVGNEMKHRPGISLSASLTRQIMPKWSIGYQFERASFNGDCTDPSQFSAVYYEHWMYKTINPEPVEYQSVVNSHWATLNRRLIDRPWGKLDASAKVGYSVINAELRYQNENPDFPDRDPVILSKKDHNPEDNVTKSYPALNALSWGLGLTCQLPLSDRLGIRLSATAISVSDDFLDAVQNMNQSGSTFVNTLYGNCSLGISYSFGAPLKKHETSGGSKKHKHWRKPGHKPQATYMPWFKR
jgi:hypothetical protein